MNATQAVMDYLKLTAKNAKHDVWLLSVSLKNGEKFHISIHAGDIDSPLMITDSFINELKFEIGRSPDAYVVTWRGLEPTTCNIIGCVSNKKFLERGHVMEGVDVETFVMDWRKLEPIDSMHHWLQDNTVDH
jgi:hypothetical protein